MSQGMLSFKNEEEKTLSSPISFAGLSAYLDFAKFIGSGKSITPLPSV